ncbi:hypothetical protein Patl1_20556 [Pistacia atlantica]|uniref:Uncharacterized protein n=1 Tax=Pistacia atlantica TaxID=434234 RepID=A0ACC1BKV6_9ROSI|nr:hypothetical protein Patl1_20556 [Pistacia atlantica]
MTTDAILYLLKNVGKKPLLVFFKNSRNIFEKDELGLEIARIALPATLALAADPIASLIDTAFIGRIGPVELAAVGVSIAVFNQVSRIMIFPLVSVTTSFVAEEDTIGNLNAEAQEDENLEEGFAVNKEMEELIPLVEPSCKTSSISPTYTQRAKTEHERRHIPSASVAMVIGTVLGLIHALFLILAAKPILNYMGVNSNLEAPFCMDKFFLDKDSPMIKPAQQYLTLRSLGAPSLLLSLAMQGIFRGFKDTKTPLYATSLCTALEISYCGKSSKRGIRPNIYVCIPYGRQWRLPLLMLFPSKFYLFAVTIPIFSFLTPWSCFDFYFLKYLNVFTLVIVGVHLSRYLISLILLWKLIENIDLLPPSFKDLQFDRFLKNGFLLMVRVIAVTFCVTLAASLAARQGSTTMAAFQICLQIWLATSLLADGLAVSAQTILASAFVKKDYDKARTTASRVLQVCYYFKISPIFLF